MARLTYRELEERVAELESRLGVVLHPSEACPLCADTKRSCANIIAEFEVERRAGHRIAA